LLWPPSESMTELSKLTAVSALLGRLWVRDCTTSADGRVVKNVLLAAGPAFQSDAVIRFPAVWVAETGTVRVMRVPSARRGSNKAADQKQNWLVPKTEALKYCGLASVCTGSPVTWL